VGVAVSFLSNLGEVYVLLGGLLNEEEGTGRRMGLPAVADAILGLTALTADVEEERTAPDLHADRASLCLAAVALSFTATASIFSLRRSISPSL
jgi:hypothetical protein